MPENQNQEQNQNQQSSQSQRRSQEQSQGNEQNQGNQNQELTPREQQLSQELEELKGQHEKEETLRRQILEDPDVAAVFELRKANKKIKVIAADDEQQEVVPLKQQITEQVSTGDIKMNELTNLELIEVLIPAIEEKIKASTEDARSVAVGEADVRFTQLEKNQNILHSAITEQLAAAQTVRLSEKYIDFDQFKEDTMRVRKENPSLPIEKCYLLAKAEAGSTIPSATEVGTERPGSSARRTVPIGRDPGRRTNYGSNVKRTSSDQAFRNTLNEGVAKVLALRRGLQ